MIAGFLLGMTCVFLWLIVTSVVEARLSTNWSLPYFKSRFLVFRQTRQVEVLRSSPISAEKVESSMPESKYPRLLFQKADGFFLFREECSRFLASGYTGIGWYQPTMHGTLMIDPQKSRIQVIGRLNWAPLIQGTAIGVMVAYFALGPGLTAFDFAVWGTLAIMLAAVCIPSYVVQRKRFAQVADLVAEHVSALP